jgi:ubiquinone/menaquinone biosynthesis C-methylase UbiE
MPDVYANIANAATATQQRLVDVMELRAAEPQQAAMRDAFIAGVNPPRGARIVEFGCGSGIIARALAMRPEVDEVVGIDPSPVFLKRARELGDGSSRLKFVQGDARSVDLPDATFDAAIFYTVLTHIPGPEKALAEARRVLKPGGRLAVFDGDYATTTVATADADPLQTCIDAAMAALVHDRWLVRRLPYLVRQAGFVIDGFTSHGYAEIAEPSYMLTLVDRGADAMTAAGGADGELAAALKAEARQRASDGRFFGHIAYASLFATKAAAEKPRR